MSQVFMAEAIIQRPIDHVWAVLTDWALTPHWMFGINSGSAHPEVVGVGQEITLMANGRVSHMRVSECDAPDFIQLASEQSGVSTYWDYSLDAVTAGVTHLELSVFSEISGWKAFASPVVNYILRQGGSRQPASLGEYIEAQ